MELKVDGLEKSFAGRQVLKGVSFGVSGGGALGLLGRNGAGKTTTIRILMDVFPPDGGEITLDERKIDYGATTFGYLPEERGLYPKKTVIEQLVYFAMLRGLGRAAAVRSVDRWLRRLGMEEYRGKRLETLSKGNQQKIQLITALAHDPDIIILDEPFSGLDPVNAAVLKDVVRGELEVGKIVIFSSHQMSYIEEFCDSIAILNGGTIVLEGNIKEIKRNYVHDRLVVRSPELTRIASELNRKCRMIGDGELLIQLGYAGEKNEVMRRLTYQYDVDEVRVYEPSMNDIFVEYASNGV